MSLNFIIQEYLCPQIVYMSVCIFICRHTEADEHAIQHCFCYTSTVLTSTLAFQKEQKLKLECQVRTRDHTRTNRCIIILQENCL